MREALLCGCSSTKAILLGRTWTFVISYGKKRCLFDMKIIGNPVRMTRISQDRAGPCGVLHATKSDSSFGCGCELEIWVGVSEARQTITRKTDAQT